MSTPSNSPPSTPPVSLVPPSTPPASSAPSTFPTPTRIDPAIGDRLDRWHAALIPTDSRGWMSYQSDRPGALALRHLHNRQRKLEHFLQPATPPEIGALITPLLRGMYVNVEA